MTGPSSRPRPRSAPVLDATLNEIAARMRGDDDTELLGERIGRWRIVRELGRGMGTV
jgi:hypothetical protein